MNATGTGQKAKIMVQNISCVLNQDSRMGGIFLGNCYGAQDVDILKQYGIRAVLTTSIETPLKYNAKDIPLHKVINAHDKDTYSILEYLDDCVEFVHRSREKTNVLVHCYAGVSRSVTIVLAYLMKKCNWNLQKALGFVRSKRVVAKPNDGFMRQLQQYEKQLQKNQVPKWTQQKYETMQHVASTNGKNNSSVDRSGRSGLQTKRHSETPIPKILITNSRSASKYPQTQKISKPTTMNNLGEKGRTSHRNSGILLRPKDLPGYKQK